MDEYTLYGILTNTLNLKCKINKIYTSFYNPKTNEKVCTIDYRKDHYKVWYKTDILQTNEHLKDITRSNYPGNLEQTIRSDIDIARCISYLEKILNNQQDTNTVQKPKNIKPHITNLWNMLQDELDQCNITEQKHYHSCTYNKRICVFFIQQKQIKVIFTQPNLVDIMPDTVKRSKSPYVKQYKTGEYDGFEHVIKSPSDVMSTLRIIYDIIRLMNN